MHTGWVENGHTAELVGDELGTFLVRGAGAGRRIQAFVGKSEDGRHLYYVEDDSFVALDVSEDRSHVLGDAPTRLPYLAHGALWSGHDAAAVGRRGRLAFTSDRRALTVWEPESATASNPIPVEGLISRVYFVGDWVIADVLPDPGAVRTVADLPRREFSGVPFSCGGLQRCEGPPRSLSLAHATSGFSAQVVAGGGSPCAWGIVLEDEDRLRIVEPSGVSTVPYGSSRCEVRFTGLRSSWVLLSCGEDSGDQLGSGVEGRRTPGAARSVRPRTLPSRPDALGRHLEGRWR